VPRMSIGLLVLRLVFGLYLCAHGAQKLFGWFGGNGLTATAGFFENIGLRPGWLHARAAGFNEFAGGLLIAAGLLTPAGAMLLIATMVAAMITVHWVNGPFGTKNGYELNVMIMAAVFCAAGVGAGRWSLDHALKINDAGWKWAAGAAVLGAIGGAGAVAFGRSQPQPAAAES
jgi:putative oxidoreductase